MGCLLLNMGTMANNLISDNTCSMLKVFNTDFITYIFIYIFRCN